MTQNEWLLEFWVLIADPNFKYTKMDLLQTVSIQEWHMIPSKSTLKKLRKRFVSDHVVRKKFPLARCCWNCGFVDQGGKVFMVRHHILPLGKGGCNRIVNIVTLCSVCHAEVHPWLKPTL